MRIETDRLVIADFTPEMAQVVHENSLDEDTRRFVPDEVFETTEEAADTLAYLIGRYGGSEGPFVHPIFLKTGENIGYVQLVGIDEGWEIGYHVAKRYTGKGYATEAVRAFLASVARDMRLSTVHGICLADNTASVRVMEKCGFREVFRGRGLYQDREQEIARFLWRA